MWARPRAKWPPGNAALQPPPEPATAEEPEQSVPPVSSLGLCRPPARKRLSSHPVNPPARPPSWRRFSHSPSRLIKRSPRYVVGPTSLFPIPYSLYFSRQPCHAHRQLRIDNFKLAPRELHIPCRQRHILAVRPMCLDHLAGSNASRLRTRNPAPATATSALPAIAPPAQ